MEELKHLVKPSSSRKFALPYFQSKIGHKPRNGTTMSITYFFLSVFGTLRFKKGSNWQICSPPFHAKKRINQIIATNRHHSWTATAFGSAKKWRQRRVARDNAFSQSLSSTILEKSLRFTLPGWSFCRALHQFKHDPGFHYSWDILAVHFARMILRFCINLVMIPII